MSSALKLFVKVFSKAKVLPQMAHISTKAEDGFVNPELIAAAQLHQHAKPSQTTQRSAHLLQLLALVQI